MDEKLKKDINNIVWWIPFKKLRNSIRNYLLEINSINIKLNHIENNINNKLNHMENDINIKLNYIENDINDKSNHIENDINNKLNHMKNDINIKLNHMENNINNKYLTLYNRIRKLTPKTNINAIEIHLADNCNLNCYSCSHFSQLAKEKYYDIITFENDIRRLYELTNGLINIFKLMGGEPLLNKNCADYFHITRKYFKNSSIWLVTNGILLPKQHENFWLSCQEDNVEIHPTKYPININWDKIKELCHNYNIPLIFYNNENVEKESRKNVFDLYGKKDSFDNFLNCFVSTTCPALNNGKIFPCMITSNIEYFNKYFNKNLEITEYDYIDIYRVNNYKEILEFLSKPVPFCRYCDISKWRSIGKWETSKKNIEEYID